MREYMRETLAFAGLILFMMVAVPVALDVLTRWYKQRRKVKRYLKERGIRRIK